MKILIITPSWIGDLVMSQTLYKELKKIYKDCQIYALAPKWCLDVLSRMPEIEQTIEMPIGHGEFNLTSRYKIAKEMRKYNFDLAFILPNSWKSALIPLFAKIPKRIGFKGECRYFLLNQMRTNKQDFPLLIQRYTSLAYSNTEVKTSDDLPEISRPLLQYYNLTNEILTKFNITNNNQLIGICPGAEYGRAKKWSPEYYAKVLTYFLNKNNNSIGLIFGSNKDSLTAQEVLNNIPKELHDRIRDLTGKTTLTQAIDLLAKTSFVICNDSGLMHISAAVNAKLVAIFGSTSTKYTPPNTKTAIIIESYEKCHPCFKRECKLGTYQCLQNIKPEMVIQKIEEHWDNL
jgi:heptosyltransferase-2